MGEIGRVARGYALGKGGEDHGRNAEALAALQSAKARWRREAPWDAAGFSARVDAIIAATAGLPTPCDPSLGGEAIRSEERRVGKECVSTCRSRWSPAH